MAVPLPSRDMGGTVLMRHQVRLWSPLTTEKMK